METGQGELAALRSEAERNLRILKRSQRREMRLLQAEDLKALFREMINGLAASYRLQTVSVVMVDPDCDIRHLLIAGGTRPRDIPGLILIEALAGLSPHYVSLRKPWLGLYNAADHQLVFTETKGLGSIAMIPLMYKQTVLGSINLGAADTARFTKDHATDFLVHLGVIASFALENTVNRARLLRSGFTDVLTGWNNRRYLQVRLGEELARAKRDASALTCLMIDIDHFKRVNDDHGHAAGDEVLREIAQCIESQVRVSDVAARYGGEEFVVLLPATDTEAGLHLAERIRVAVSADPFDLGNGQSKTITTSIGVASAMPHSDDADLKSLGESLLARADVALYAAKSSGRDRVVREQPGNAA